METRIEGDSLVCTDTETIRGEVQRRGHHIESAIRISGEWSVDIPRLVNAVGEDSELIPAEKELSYNTTKADDRFLVNAEARGPMQRYLGKRIYDTFELTELRVNTESTSGKRMKPHHFSGGTITGVKGYIPIGALKSQSGSRDNSTLAEVVSNEVSEPDDTNRSDDEDEEPANGPDDDDHCDLLSESFDHQSALSW